MLQTATTIRGIPCPAKSLAAKLICKALFEYTKPCHPAELEWNVQVWQHIACVQFWSLWSLERFVQYWLI